MEGSGWTLLSKGQAGALGCWKERSLCPGWILCRPFGVGRIVWDLDAGLIEMGSCVVKARPPPAALPWGLCILVPLLYPQGLGTEAWNSWTHLCRG